MAIGIITDMRVFDEQFYGGFIETVQDNIDVFNGASFDTMRLITEFHRGQRNEEAYMVRSNGRFRRTLGSTAAHTPQNLPSDSVKEVKLFDGVHYEQTLQSYKTAGLSPEQIAFNAGVQAAGDIMEGWREGALSALFGCYDLAALQPAGGSDLVHDHTAVGDGTVNSASLIKSLRLFGDRSSRIRTWVMHSDVYFDLIGNQEASTTADGIADMVVMSGTPATLGKPVIVVDSPALIEVDAGGPGVDHYRTYGLVPGAVTIKESESPSNLSELVGGLNNLVHRVQSEYVFTVGVKGISYTGADNPSDAALATNTNWGIKFTSKKDLPGVMLKSLAS